MAIYFGAAATPCLFDYECEGAISLRRVGVSTLINRHSVSTQNDFLHEFYVTQLIKILHVVVYTSFQRCDLMRSCAISVHLISSQLKYVSLQFS
jgi:hypothetical protein